MWIRWQPSRPTLARSVSPQGQPACQWQRRSEILTALISSLLPPGEDGVGCGALTSAGGGPGGEGRGCRRGQERSRNSEEGQLLLAGSRRGSATREVKRLSNLLLKILKRIAEFRLFLQISTRC